MPLIGLDIGGTKIAGGAFTPGGERLAETTVPTTHDYAAFLESCQDVIEQLEKTAGAACSVGIGMAGRIGRDNELGDPSPNMVFLRGRTPRRDLENLIGREVRLANDANCMTLAEAVDGAGQGATSVLGLILGTGAGAGFVVKGEIIGGANGMTGEIGHLPLPYREDSDGPAVKCECGQTGCLDKSISGGALARLFAMMTGKEADAKTISERARANDAEALGVLDRYYEVAAKGMVTVLHTFDPDVIVVGGGLSKLPGLYDEVPKRWSKYAYITAPKTKLVPAVHGPTSGMRGAAWLWR